MPKISCQFGDGPAVLKPLAKRTRQPWAGRQLRFEAQGSQGLPDVFQAVEEVLPAGGHARPVSVANGGVLLASIGRQDEDEVVGEDQPWRVRWDECVAQPGQFGLQRPATLAEQITPGSREAEHCWGIIDLQ